MCSLCKMDPKEVAAREQRQGAVEPDDFYVEFNYSKRTKKKSKKEKTRPGCPENDFKAHVYIWTTEFESRDMFFDYFGYPKYQHKVCVGCEKFNGSKLSDKYLEVKNRKWDKLEKVEKGVPVPRFNRYGSFRWWNWEYYDEDYMAFRKKYIERHGWPRYLYGNLF